MANGSTKVQVPMEALENTNYAINNGIAMYSTNNSTNSTIIGSYAPTTGGSTVWFTLLWTYTDDGLTEGDGFTGTFWCYDPGPFANETETAITEQAIQNPSYIQSSIQSWFSEQGFSGFGTIGSFLDQIANKNKSCAFM